MSYDKPRLQLNHSLPDILWEMSKGNPGAASVLIRLFAEGSTIDPHDAFGGMGSIMALDSHDIYESNIWLLYKDVCGENLSKMVALLRAVQLGYLSEAELRLMLRNKPTKKTLDALFKQVTGRLERFVLTED
jgi:hypothetical protein